MKLMIQDESVSSTLVAISALVRPQERFGRALRRTWFWRPEVLVLDFETRTGVTFAAEILLASNGRLALHLTGRGIESTHAVKRICALMGSGKSVPSKPRHLLVQEWQSSNDLAAISSDISVALARILAGMDSTHLGRQADALPGFWWYLKVNFGDLVGPFLMQQILKRPVFNAWPEPAAGPALASAGSILGGLDRDGMEVWGTGLMSPVTNEGVRRLRGKQWNVHAVRGKLTHNQLTEELGWRVPKVYGDPGLLVADFFQPSEARDERELGVIPHYVHKRSFAQHKHQFLIDVERSVQEVASDIASCSVVISSSLHGLILAQSYGVPWVWLRVGDKHLGGGDFKFEDFFSTLRGDVDNVERISYEDIASLDLVKVASKARLPEEKASRRNLLDAFPIDSPIWSKKS